MQTIEIARRMAELGQDLEALRAYTLAVRNGGLVPEETLEAAIYILQNGGDYQVSYTCFLNLYQQGYYREETLALLTGAFYEPNIKELRGRYERNVKLLKKYPYLFRKDFPSFEELPIQFYPYRNDCYIPFSPDRLEFGEFMDIKKPVITRNFFHDLENPILAEDVYSQYELEYLRDNVRRSEDVGQENHVYLHYTNWETFCSYLQCLNIRPLLKEEKILFLIEDEIVQYPIDFKERFNIDYSRYPKKPVALREITRMIWLSQLSSHNGINFFTEIFDGHPNLISVPPISLQKTVDTLKNIQKALNSSRNVSDACRWLDLPSHLAQELYLTRDVTDKECLVASVLADERFAGALDPTSRIAPALVFQPHFGHLEHTLTVDSTGKTVLFSPAYEEISASPIFKGFKYIKTVAPLRRPTTGYAAAVRYMHKGILEGRKNKDDTYGVIDDELIVRILNRSYLVDWQDRLFQDSILVRFEDAKLNPKATFTALAAFLDIPYTESLTYCSRGAERDPESFKGDARGFDTRAVFEAYSDYANDAERYFLEYFTRDAYESYGYDFQWYDGQPMDEDKAGALIQKFSTLDSYIQTTWKIAWQSQAEEMLAENETIDEKAFQKKTERFISERLSAFRENRLSVAKTLLQGLRFVNRNGQPLHMMPLLKLDPALLEQPLYH